MHVHSLVSRTFHIVRVTIGKYKLKVDYTEELKRDSFQQVLKIENHVHACVSDNILYFWLPPLSISTFAMTWLSTVIVDFNNIDRHEASHNISFNSSCNIKSDNDTKSYCFSALTCCKNCQELFYRVQKGLSMILIPTFLQTISCGTKSTCYW
jgi:hypothetical protein